MLGGVNVNGPGFAENGGQKARQCGPAQGPRQKHDAEVPILGSAGDASINDAGMDERDDQQEDQYRPAVGKRSNGIGKGDLQNEKEVAERQKEDGRPRGLTRLGRQELAKHLKGDRCMEQKDDGPEETPIGRSALCDLRWPFG